MNQLTPLKLDKDPEVSAFIVADRIMHFLIKAEAYSVIDEVFTDISEVHLRQEPELIPYLDDLYKATKAAYVDVNNDRGDPNIISYISYGLYETLMDIGAADEADLIARIYYGFYFGKGGSVDEQADKAVPVAEAIRNFINAVWED